eukprot:gene3518-8308_t
MSDLEVETTSHCQSEADLVSHIATKNDEDSTISLETALESSSMPNHKHALNTSLKRKVVVVSDDISTHAGILDHSMNDTAESAHSELLPQQNQTSHSFTGDASPRTDHQHSDEIYFLEDAMQQDYDIDDSSISQQLQKPLKDLTIIQPPKAPLSEHLATNDFANEPLSMFDKSTDIGIKDTTPSDVVHQTHITSDTKVDNEPITTTQRPSQHLKPQSESGIDIIPDYSDEVYTEQRDKQFEAPYRDSNFESTNSVHTSALNENAIHSDQSISDKCESSGISHPSFGEYYIYNDDKKNSFHVTSRNDFRRVRVVSSDTGHSIDSEEVHIGHGLITTSTTSEEYDAVEDAFIVGKHDRGNTSSPETCSAYTSGCEANYSNDSSTSPSRMPPNPRWQQVPLNFPEPSFSKTGEFRARHGNLTQMLLNAECAVRAIRGIEG